MSTPTTSRLRALDVDTCLARLGQHYLGRLAFVAAGGVRIIPLNYLLHEGSVIVRLGRDGPLDAIAGADVAFEIDEVDVADHTGWSVVVTGRAEEVWRVDELEALRDLPLRPWAPGDRDHFIRIVSTAITGRELA